MNRKLLAKPVLIIIAILLLAPWPVAYAYGEAGGGNAVRIEAADATAVPAARVIAGAVGTMQPGYLFYVNTAANPADMKANLYITNGADLVRAYSYVILQVTVEVQDAEGRWQPAYAGGVPVIEETYITLQTPVVSFMLRGGGSYRVGIAGGSLYAFQVTGEGMAPRFYLEID